MVGQSPGTRAEHGCSTAASTCTATTAVQNCANGARESATGSVRTSSHDAQHKAACDGSLQVLVFGSVILSGANILAEGSELLLEVLDPGLIGGAPSPISRALLQPARNASGSAEKQHRD